jgi:hypothetical protein
VESRQFNTAALARRFGGRPVGHGSDSTENSASYDFWAERVPSIGLKSGYGVIGKLELQYGHTGKHSDAIPRNPLLIANRYCLQNDVS